ncbi:hypothetical protein HPB52_017841 [Rhipicephalus sanguineus]|uniref:Uncharacterized protein n=1 Tax=Rhipicephalus sanguineus TaxID=34632 RepID=A0A9D4SQJ4_RHISA|nr:hypothetical protein HPB52_017841 [Rhipicephalus sanguineus]
MDQWGQDSYEIMYGKDMIAESTLTNFQSYVEGRLRDFVGADAVMLVTGFGDEDGISDGISDETEDGISD